ncbi:MAG: 23S rRNA (pseudouridine(1915)-N(3))-methyltransferase RlmH [Candidatus Porifericomitaceae bacterium WSBS_2022_MAG_OTU9]
MRLTIIAVGNKDPEWVRQACDMYVKRLPTSLQPKTLILPTKQGSGAKHREGLEILKKASCSSNMIALDEKGESWDTKMLATKMNDWMINNLDISFIIGGSEGLSKDCLATATTIWSLSRLTLPHAMVKVVLMEQLYRAWSILQKHPYHRG